MEHYISKLVKSAVSARTLAWNALVSIIILWQITPFYLMLDTGYAMSLLKCCVSAQHGNTKTGVSYSVSSRAVLPWLSSKGQVLTACFVLFFCFLKQQCCGISHYFLDSAYRQTGQDKPAHFHSACAVLFVVLLGG